MSSRRAQEQFALQLPSLEVRDMPLVSFLQLLSRLGGVPVSISASELQMAGISARKEVSLEARNVTLDAALSQVLEPLRLEHRFDGAQVIVSRKSADKMRDVDYPLDDLVSSAAEAEQLTDWIEQLVAPGSWDSASMDIVGDKLRVQQTQQVHFQLLTFVERLRMVRGLDTRSRFPVARLAPTPLHAAMAPRLSRSAMFTFTQDTPLSEIFLHWQRELEVPFLVDWPALAEVELWPDNPVACAIADRNWQEGLTAVLQPLGLDWRVCYGGGIEISSALAFGSDRQLELYRITAPQRDGGTELVAQLQQHLAGLPSAQSSPQQAQIIYDAKGPAVIALLPASAQRDVLQWLIERKLFAPR